MQQNNIRYYASIFIVLMLQISQGVGNEDTLSNSGLFKEIINYSENRNQFRLVLVGNKINKECFWDSCRAVITQLSDSVLNSGVDFPRDNTYPPITHNYSEGVFFFKTKGIFFLRTFYRARIFFDTERYACCLWCYKTDWNGTSSKRTESITEKIAQELIKRKVMQKIIAEYRY